jgi:hypothetical protein
MRLASDEPSVCEVSCQLSYSWRRLLFLFIFSTFYSVPVTVGKASLTDVTESAALSAWVTAELQVDGVTSVRRRLS